ncbi:hypothetical protein [Burkholderia ubonensis]|uniref:hypothetical protein n=1 Tax=Burkholderia ubonensis TaxID=101571 RepID=UPI00091C8E2A|nr:hypothetical protein [Burkholderia ubonensis]OJB35403.1 hypothetical protein BGV48_00310 [Burkholderia ubonensis]
MTTESKKSPAPEQASEARRSAETAAVGAVTAEAIVEQPEGTGNETSSKFSDGKSRADALTDIDSWAEGAKFALRTIAKHDICFLTDSMKMTAVKLATEACVAEKERLLNEYPVEQPAAAPADERTTTFDEWLERYVTETGGRVFPPDALRACWHASAAAANDTGAEGAEPQPSFDERKEFEAWARDQGYSIYGDPRVRDAYGGATQSAWRGWMGRSRLTDGRAVTLLRQARDELSNIEWENDPPDRIYALFGDIDKYVSGSPAMAAAAPADERAAFEAWARPDSVQQKHDASGEYAEPGMSAAWAGWQARAAASPAAEAHAEIVSKMERLISAVNAYTGIGSWYAKQIQDLCSSLLKTLAAQQPAQVATKASHEIVAEQQRTHEFVQFADRTRYVASIDPNAGVGPYPHPPAQADAPATIPDECAASGASCSYAPEGRHGEMQCGYCGKAQADALAEAVDSDGLTPRADLERDPLWQWRCIANEAEIVVTRKGKFLMLSEEMCVRLGSALEDSPPAEAREPVTRESMLAAIDEFELVCDNNLARDLSPDEKFAVSEFVIGFFENAPAIASASDGKPITYVSTQATNCAQCGQHNHTPLRIDWMGGYVCLTCIDRELESRAPADAGLGDAIARSKRILALVDDYHEKPTADRRTTLRQALMVEFETAPPAARMARVASLTREQVSEVWDSMPGGGDGFMKQWGYYQFALEILNRAQLLNGADNAE